MIHIAVSALGNANDSESDLDDLNDHKPPRSSCQIVASIDCCSVRYAKLQVHVDKPLLSCEGLFQNLHAFPAHKSAGLNSKRYKRRHCDVRATMSQ